MKRLFFILIIAICLYIIKGLATSIYTLWQKQDLIVQAQKELEMQKDKHNQLQKQLSYSQTQQFIEEEARDKLFMGKPNEQTVILPTDFLTKQPKTKTIINSSPNLKKWLELFY